MAKRIENWWAKTSGQLLDDISVDLSKGLSPNQVEQNRSDYGHNQIEDSSPTSIWVLLWESVKSPMIILLLTVAGISLALGQLREAIVMVFVVAMYIGVHLLNKARSDRTMASLREVQAPKTLVLREGKTIEIPLEEVVVGDVLILQSGTRVPADARVVASAGLIINEAPLTGESAPVAKSVDAEIPPDAQLADRKTAIFAGTTVLDGQGQALVMSVGKDTELGKVAEMVSGGKREPTPLQKEMNDLASTLAYIAIGVSFLVPLIGFLRGFNLQEMVLTWLSLTFLMVPGQPPIIIAIALALAALELARKKVIVRQLRGAETLGSVNVVVSDKTGTMTENRMELTSILFPDDVEIVLNSEQDRDKKSIQHFLEVARLAIPEISNDPTDSAIIQAYENQSIQAAAPGDLIDQIGFSRSGDYRSLEYAKDGKRKIYITGRPEVLIDASNRRLTSTNGSHSVETFTEQEKSRFRDKIREWAAQGSRITAYAYSEVEETTDGMKNLIFSGAAVLSDPVRPEVEPAIRRLEKAGVQTLMITGDIPETAASVANQVGLDGSRLIKGSELEKMSDAELEIAVGTYSVFARTTPEHKLRLVEALQRQNKTVAVTGDGINDAPALRTAHIGIAMGQRGTDAAREAADLVLTDDNFSHLTDGVAIGRKAYDNFRKGITYYLSAKAILLSIFIVPLAFGIIFPLAPIQIIFTELLMDLASSTIFVSESAEPDVMERNPRKPGRFLTWDVARRILRNMAGLTLAILGVYFISISMGFDLDNARTAVFATWLLGHIVLALNLKQEKIPLFKQGLFSNKFAIGWLFGMIALVLAMTQVPFVQSIMQTTELAPTQWILVISGSLLASMWLEAAKWIRQRS